MSFTDWMNDIRLKKKNLIQRYLLKKVIIPKAVVTINQIMTIKKKKRRLKDIDLEMLGIRWILLLSGE